MNKIIELGAVVCVVVDYKKYARFSRGEIVNIVDNEIHIATHENGKSTGTIIVYKEQKNAFILKDKKRAWSLFLAKQYRGTKLDDHKGQLRKDIKESISQFPELWV